MTKEVERIASKGLFEGRVSSLETQLLCGAVMTEIASRRSRARASGAPVVDESAGTEVDPSLLEEGLDLLAAFRSVKEADLRQSIRGLVKTISAHQRG